MQDALYNRSHNPEEEKQLLEARPWRKDPSYFKNVRISALALLKMVTHARSGGSLEVMGLMQGKVIGNSFIITDAFRLPVEGTETRVNAQEEANEYMVQYLQSSREVGQTDNAVGWYHSHPGYGCWLSGIDVSTQMTQQMQDPFLAVVIDPERTMSTGKVDIGAFRTYPEGHKAPGEQGGDGYQSIPLAKIEDFGAHSSRYYSLEVSFYKSTLDSYLLEQLWRKYWVSTLSRNPLLANRDYTTKQMEDLGEKVRKAEQGISYQARLGQGTGNREVRITEHLDKVVRDSNKLAGMMTTGSLANVVNKRLFG